MKHRNEFRSRADPAYWAFVVHRLSGLALAVYLPVHFWALGQAIAGVAALDGFLKFTDQPLFKIGEWGIVVLLALHLMGGVRVLAMEFLRWSSLSKNWIAAVLGFGLVFGMAFALALIG